MSKKKHQVRLLKLTKPLSCRAVAEQAGRKREIQAASLIREIASFQFTLAVYNSLIYIFIT